MTINILKKWEKLGDNYLDSNLDYTNDVYQKISINQVVKKTIENFPKHIEKRDFKPMLEALYRINSKVKQKASNDRSIITVYNRLMDIACTKLENYSFKDVVICITEDQRIEEIDKDLKILELKREILELKLVQENSIVGNIGLEASILSKELELERFKTGSKSEIDKDLKILELKREILELKLVQENSIVEDIDLEVSILSKELELELLKIGSKSELTNDEKIAEIAKIDKNLKILKLRIGILELKLVQENSIVEDIELETFLCCKEVELDLFKFDSELELKNKKFYTKVLFDLLLSKIIQKKVAKGIIYEIENKEGYVSYLIGTHHGSLKNHYGEVILDGDALLKGTIIPEVVKNSSEFISEIGEERIKANSMDEKLTILAKNNNIPIYALETPQELMKARFSFSNYFLKSKFNKKTEKLRNKDKLHILMNYKKYPQLISFSQLISWRNGNTRALESNSKVLESYSLEMIKECQAAKKRNKNWLENTKVNLLDKLKTTKHPISIVVGSFHLFGKTGLLKRFEDEGLKIRQV